ncbi:hypothetical protein ACMGGS_06720 [Superficieibacter sp. BNK-5]|uniref:hypothetical protein n=1 Tax=Superficieibacter sp. BNK-5 TaxID=3376142 RepID=UPI0039BF49D4
MSAQERKKRHQQGYQQQVEAVRSGQTPSQVMERAPSSIVPCKKPRKISFF